MATKNDIDVSYGVSNDFYRLFLDTKYMTYSCGLFLDENDSLEQAQVNKFEHHCRAAKVTAHSHILDIGCGWGSLMQYIAESRSAKRIAGITLSEDQYREVLRREIPHAEAHCVSYLDYQPDGLFDSVISIGMIEHIATPQDARSGRHIDIYRDYFKRAWQWTKPGSYFSLQSVLGLKYPRGKDLRDLAWGTYTIFPGAISPRLESFIQSAHPYWEVREVYTRREHYARTAQKWVEQLRQHQEEVIRGWGREKFQEYEKYLDGCVRAFSGGYLSLAQITLSRNEIPVAA